MNKLFSFSSLSDKMTGVKVVPNPTKKYKKRTIPKGLKEQVWIQRVGHVFETKCPVVWCENRITCFNFHTGHNIPESKGGKTVLENLIPICDRCNTSMGDRHTIDEWNTLGESTKAFIIPVDKIKSPWYCCFN